MFPHINSENRDIRSIDRILILGSLNLKSPLSSTLTNEPAPARTLKTEEFSTEGFDEGIVGSPSRNDSLTQDRRMADIISRGAGWSEVLPEEGVVDVAATVEAELLLESDQGGNII